MLMLFLAPLVLGAAAATQRKITPLDGLRAWVHDDVLSEDETAGILRAIEASSGWFASPDFSADYTMGVFPVKDLSAAGGLDLAERISELVGAPAGAMDDKGITVRRFSPTSYFDRHVDRPGDEYPADVTVALYLQSARSVDFPNANASITPKPGRAGVWMSNFEDGSQDERSAHEVKRVLPVVCALDSCSAEMLEYRYTISAAVSAPWQDNETMAPTAPDWDRASWFTEPHKNRAPPSFLAHWASVGNPWTTWPTDAPSEVTDAPSEVTDAPTDIPTVVTDVPTEVTNAPSEVTDAPSEVTDAPSEATDAPTGATDAPTEVTDAPTGATDAPTEETDEPTEATVTDEPTTSEPSSPQPSEEPTEATVTDEPTEDFSAAPVPMMLSCALSSVAMLVSGLV